MKQVIQNYKSGDMSVRDTPAPQLQSKGVLVRTAYSLISAGTERSMVEMARKSLIEKARSRPDLVRKVLDKARTEGFLSAYSKAMVRLSTDSTLGYSSAGVVLAVGSEVKGLRVGMRVACAGVGYANHAELVYVPRSLCVPVPDSIDLKGGRIHHACRNRASGSSSWLRGLGRGCCRDWPRAGRFTVSTVAKGKRVQGGRRGFGPRKMQNGPRLRCR